MSNQFKGCTEMNKINVYSIFNLTVLVWKLKTYITNQKPLVKSENYCTVTAK